MYKLLNRRNIGKWDTRVFTGVKKLINKKMIPPLKYDGRKNKTYPSSRMIVYLINKKFRKKISKSTVNILIQEYRQV